MPKIFHKHKKQQLNSSKKLGGLEGMGPGQEMVVEEKENAISKNMKKPSTKLITHRLNKSWLAIIPSRLTLC